MANERLDILLVEAGYFPTREKARAAIMAGLIRLGPKVLDKAGLKLPELPAELKVLGDACPYVSRGGLKLAQALSAAFDQIEAAVPRPIQAGPKPLVISCLPTFAMKWLIPRLPRFQAAHPEIPVRVAESNGPFDFKDDGIDLAIRMRSPDTVVTYDSVVTPFMEHFHGPVMAPELAIEPVSGASTEMPAESSPWMLIVPELAMSPASPPAPWTRIA